MRIIAFSDTHGNFDCIETIYRAQPHADYYLHLGDGYAQAQHMLELHPEMPLLSVVGNCDVGIRDKDTKVLSLPDGRKILYTHGHRFHVKYGLGDLCDAAEEMGVCAAFFGHTHEPFCQKIGDIWYINPGSAPQYNCVRFATLEIVGGTVYADATACLRDY